MMTLPEFKAWVDSIHYAAPAISQQLLLQRIQDKLRAECASGQQDLVGSQITRQWDNRADRGPTRTPGETSYIEGPWGPEQPM